MSFGIIASSATMPLPPNFQGYVSTNNSTSTPLNNGQTFTGIGEDDSVYGVYGDHKIQNKLKLPNSQAKEILGKPICDWIEQRFNWFYQKFRY